MDQNQKILKRLSETAARVLANSPEFQAEISLLTAGAQKTKGAPPRQGRTADIKRMFTHKALKTQAK